MKRHLQPILLGALFAVAFGDIAANAWINDQNSQRDGGRDTSSTAPVSPQDLIAKHDCWQGEAPADMVRKIPGHVVVTTADGRTVYGGERLAGLALEQQFDGKDAGLKIWGFCR